MNEGRDKSEAWGRTSPDPMEPSYSSAPIYWVGKHFRASWDLMPLWTRRTIARWQLEDTLRRFQPKKRKPWRQRQGGHSPLVVPKCGCACSYCDGEHDTCRWCGRSGCFRCIAEHESFCEAQDE